ncbi:hypothetical protein [Streptomyces sp. C184]|uniref:hypothetical protein n=1 Tax=Streptomyces sp. C184 TaxID=3237121 RepID=UPI0034C6C187
MPPRRSSRSHRSLKTAGQAADAPSRPRELIVSGTRESLDAARARGRVGGRPTAATPEIIRAARDMLPNPENSITSIAEILGVSPGTTTSPTCKSSAPPAAFRTSSPLADRSRYRPFRSSPEA